MVVRPQHRVGRRVPRRGQGGALVPWGDEHVTTGSSCRDAPDQVGCITGLVTKRIGTGARGSLVELNRIGQRPGARRATLSRAVVRGRSPGPGDSEAPGASGAAHRSRL